VIEDSKIGLDAALAAGMRCFVTFTESTRDQDFTGASAVVAGWPDGSTAMSAHKSRETVARESRQDA